MRGAPSGEGLRREALEARRVFAEQSLRTLPRVRRLARELWGALCFKGFMATVEKVSHEKGPTRYVLRAREERNRRLLEEGASTLEKQLIERGIL